MKQVSSQIRARCVNGRGANADLAIDAKLNACR